MFDFDFLFLPSLTLLVLGVCLRVSLRLLYGARGPRPDDGIYLFMRILSWCLLLIPVGVLAVASFNMLALIFVAAIIEAMCELILARRAAQRHAAWRLVLASLGGGRPVLDSLRYHQARFTGIVGRAYRGLIADLEHGLPWVGAISANRRAFPREAPAMAGVIGNAPAAAAEILEFDEMRDVTYMHMRQTTVQRFAYLITVGVMMLAIILFVMIKIVPSYQEIFSDFDLELPKITLGFIGMADWFQRYAAVPLGVFVLYVVCVGSLLALLHLCDLPALEPVIDRLNVARRRATVMRILAAALGRGMPMEEVLGQLVGGGSAYPSKFMRRKLDAALLGVAAGHEWQAALQGAGLISANDAAALRAAQQAGNLPWTLRMLADRKARRSAFRWAAAQQVAFVVLVLLLAAFVLWYSVAMFVPLTDLIWSLSS